MKNLLAVLFTLAMTTCTFTGNTATPAASTLTPLPSAAPTTPTPAPAGTTPGHWWNDAIFYELTVRSFYDSNGDGIGDFNGLIEKLDYLNDGDPATTTDLGVTGIWLLPIHPSPSTHGFDITDYYSVNPQYGTMDDFRRLVAEAHRRGIRVIIDLVLHDTSRQHPWFVQSQDPASSYHDWYIWEDTDPGTIGPWNQQVWFPLNGDYYYALFWEGLPTLNNDNPEVIAEMENVIKFWLADVGIDGFRLDSVGSLMGKSNPVLDSAAAHEWMANYYRFYKDINPEAMTIAEVWTPDAKVIPWVANKQVDLAFEFDLSFAMIASINEGNSTKLRDTLNSGTSKFPPGQYGTFLTNHDMARVMTQLGGNPAKAKAAASLYFTLPGVPFIYYGEEIGQRNETPDKLDLRPMQWTGGPYAGFSDVTPWAMPGVDPVFNVTAETGDPNSLLSHYRKLIALRNSHTALRTGDLFLLSSSNQGLFAYLRTEPNEAVLTIVNLTASTIKDYRLSLVSPSPLTPGEHTPVSLMDETPLATLTVRERGDFLNYTPVSEIPPYATIMMQVQSK